MSYLKSYVRYIKGMSEETKNLHSIFIAGMMTGVFIVIYLYLVRGIAPPAPDMADENVYVRSTQPSMEQLINTNATSIDPVDLNPFSVVGDIFKKAGQDISSIKSELDSTRAAVNSALSATSSKALNTSPDITNASSSTTGAEYYEHDMHGSAD